MTRFLPLALIPLVALSAWRREAGVQPTKHRTPESRRSSRNDPTPETPAPVVPVPSSDRLPSGREEREHQLQQRVELLETELQLALDKVDAHRVKLARALNDNQEGRLQLELEYSRQHAALLEADLQRLETAYVELAARHRRSD